MKKNFDKTILNVLTAATLILIAFFLFSSVIVITTSNLKFQLDYIGLSQFIEIFKIPLTTLAVLGAIITLRLTARRVLQTDKQLILLTQQISASRQPEIFINPQRIYVLTRNDATYKDKMFISASKKISYSNIIITNVGLGTAIHVNLEFKYDIYLAVALIQKVNDSKWFTITYPVKDLIHIKNANSDYEESFVVNDTELKNYTNYITAIRDIKYSTSLATPNAYFFLYTIYLSLLGHERDEIESAFQGRIIESGIREFPKLSLDVTYSDIGNFQHHKIFQIDVEYQKFVNPFYEGKFRHTENYFNLIVRPILL